MKRIIIIGNGGSGKTWLAQELAKKFSYPVLHFDEVFWEPGGFNRKRDKELVEKEILDFAKKEQWIMEGVFGELVELALARIDLLVFLDMSWDYCEQGLQQRGYDKTSAHSLKQAKELFEKLLDWSKDYWKRTDKRSQIGHSNLAKAVGDKAVVLKSREEVLSFLSRF